MIAAAAMRELKKKFKPAEDVCIVYNVDVIRFEDENWRKLKLLLELEGREKFENLSDTISKCLFRDFWVEHRSETIEFT